MNDIQERKMRTKNLLLLMTVVTMALILAACNGTSIQANSTTSSTGTDGAQAGTSLSQVNMLLIGTLKLEDTDQAVTANEAAKLLPLWQAYRSLSTSQTTAEAEVEALLNQIQITMNSNQVQAIKAMNLSSSDMMNLMQSMGGGMGPQGTPNPQSTPGFDFPSEGFPSGDQQSGSAGALPGGSNGGTTRQFPSGGAMPGGNMGGGMVIGGDAGSAAGLGGGPILQGTQNPSMQATAQARFSTKANQVNSILLDVLITKLEARTAE
jgi:hypothetical protein